jgi:RNA polymerase sigma-70 factor (ECF subfamily)
MLGISRNLCNYEYNPKICRFKTWLLNQTSWRIKDQLRKRKKEAAWSNAGSGSGRARGSFSPGDDTTLAAAINQVPDPASVDVGAKVEEQWRMSLFEMALERVKEKFSLKQFQIFDLLAVKEWPAAEVARALGVTATNAYVTRHRISAAIKKETKRIEQQLEQAAGSSRKK